MRAAATTVLFLLTACAVPTPPPAVPAPAPPPPPVAAPAPEAAAPPEVAAPSEPVVAPDAGAPSTALRLYRSMDLALIEPVTVGSSGAEPHVPGPDVAFGRVLATAEIMNAARVVAGLRQRFRVCYKSALSNDPNLVGVVALDLAVGPDGQVTSVRASQAKGVSSSVVACFSLVARQAQFSAPAGGRAMLSIPLTLVQQ